MPCLRHNSAVPRPASDSFNIPTICSSVNRLFFNFVLLAWPERTSLAGELSFTLVQFLGSTSNNHNHGFLFKGGTYIHINVPNATDTSANGINDNGDIVGTYSLPGSSTN